MVIYADHYLLDWEREHKAINERWRTMARNELAATGTVPNETTMRAWKARKDREFAAKKMAPEEKSDLLKELEAKAKA